MIRQHVPFVHGNHPENIKDKKRKKTKNSRNCMLNIFYISLSKRVYVNLKRWFLQNWVQTPVWGKFSCTQIYTLHVCNNLFLLSIEVVAINL
jgi:hypothetical protein